MKIDGGCYCGYITFEGEADPDKTTICHCTDCQALTGTAFRVNVGIPDSTFRMLSGEPDDLHQDRRQRRQAPAGLLPEMRDADLLDGARRRSEGLHRPGRHAAPARQVRPEGAELVAIAPAVGDRAWLGSRGRAAAIGGGRRGGTGFDRAIDGGPIEHQSGSRHRQGERRMCVPGCQEAVRSALSRRGFFKGAAAAGFAATAVVPAQAQRAPSRSFTRTVDLTHVMSPEFPTFFGVPGIEMEKKFDLKKDGFNLYWWRIIEHAGTHLDAPIHFSETGNTADKIPADTLVVPLAVVDVAAKAAQNPDYMLTRDDLAAWEKKHRRLPDNCCVAMHSGWARHVGDAAKFTGKDAAGVFHFPGVSPEAAQWLMKERKVLGLAVDTLSLDVGTVEGLQGALFLAAVGPLGARERRPSRPGPARRARRWWSDCRR